MNDTAAEWSMCPMSTTSQAARKVASHGRELTPEAVAAAIARRLLPPISKLELFITERCNLRCDYCFVRPADHRGAMPWETARAAVDLLLRECGLSPKLSLTLFGGEPLLEIDLLESLLEYGAREAECANKEMGFSLTTNGTLLDERALRLGRRYGFNFLVSVDGGPATHDRHRRFPGGRGSFAEIMERLPSVKRIQGWVGTRMTVTPETIADLPGNFTYLVHQGFNQFIIAREDSAPWGPEGLRQWRAQVIAVRDEYDRFRAAGYQLRNLYFDDCESGESVKRSGAWGCDAGRTKLAVGANGDLYPCTRFAPSPAGAQWRVGTVLEGVLDYRPRVLLSFPRIPSSCRNCPREKACVGGCPAVNVEEIGTPFGPTQTNCSAAELTSLLASRATTCGSRGTTLTVAPPGVHTGVTDPSACGPSPAVPAHSQAGPGRAQEVSL